MLNKRYFIFAFDEILCMGGMDDKIGSVGTLDEVKPFLKSKKHQMVISQWQVLDLVTGDIVLEGGYSDLL